MSQEIETFLWKGQRMYRCPVEWESGTKCTWSTYDLQELRKHMAEPHTRNGKPSPRSPQRIVSALVDSEGKPIVYEQRAEPEVAPEFQGYKFKEE